MALTARQQEIFADIETGIKFLSQQHPDRRKFEVKEIMLAAGQDNAISLYRLIKTLRKKGEADGLHRMRALFQTAGVIMEPLEAWFQAQKTGSVDAADDAEDWAVEAEPEELVLESEPEPKAQAPKGSVPQQKPLVNDYQGESDVTVITEVEAHINSLSQILRIMAPMSRSARESVHDSIESFFKIGSWK